MEAVIVPTLYDDVPRKVPRVAWTVEGRPTGLRQDGLVLELTLPSWLRDDEEAVRRLVSLRVRWADYGERYAPSRGKGRRPVLERERGHPRSADQQHPCQRARGGARRETRPHAVQKNPRAEDHQEAQHADRQEHRFREIAEADERPGRRPLRGGRCWCEREPDDPGGRKAEKPRREEVRSHQRRPMRPLRTQRARWPLARRRCAARTRAEQPPPH